MNNIFSNTGNLGPLTEGNPFTLSGEQLGTVTNNSNGYCELTFNANATAAKVDEVLQSITYSNSNETDGSQVVLEFSFSDGNLYVGNSNVGAQGYGEGNVTMQTTIQFFNATANTTSRTHTIPSMNEYGMMMLIMIIMVSATRRMRRQEQ
ncbi:MAG: hypothetical protein OMM_03842 [Candidatus Magnetoglobus multicellularis str. Araruama]|uniref:IPTL-CTERM protein sorting domain-containing protein n=1 Tax=Candidatus Magnetoglobus multicellularis str. Araruama TaxID=890399 RepID=A0A1V1P3W4_9BACT|nr:MAG: hypothetical protein OMM_03842 [Candidatus Magnetoglobus multicellularis str. Araruama]